MTALTRFLTTTSGVFAIALATFGCTKSDATPPAARGGVATGRGAEMGSLPVEVVSIDTGASTITVSDAEAGATPRTRTLSVDTIARSDLLHLTPGDKVTITCSGTEGARTSRPPEPLETCTMVSAIEPVKAGSRGR